MSESAIKIENLRFSYNQKNDVVHIPSFEVARGQKVFLHGLSGSGKSTFLGLLAGILSANSGSINLLGNNLTAMKPSERDYFRGSHIGYIFQMFNLISYLSVSENIELPVRMNAERLKRLQGADIRTAAQDLANKLGIGSLMSQRIDALSVGQQQRVATARALMGSPEIIIADEPTSALDLDHRKKFLDLLFESAARYRATVLFVSHDHTLKNSFDRCVALTEINRVEDPR